MQFSSFVSDAQAVSTPHYLPSTMSTEASGKGVLLKADPIANAFRDEIQASLATRPRPPRLVGILATSAAPSKFYAEFTKKQCDALGVEFVLRWVGAAADPTLSEGDGVEEAIIEANEDENVHGIMVGNVLNKSLSRTVYVCCHRMPGLLSDLRRSAGLCQKMQECMHY